MSREATEYIYICDGCGKTERTAGDSYPASWEPVDNENYDDDAEDYCPACQAKRQP